MKPIAHGTNAGYSRHRYYREKACDDCTVAHSAHNAERLANSAAARATQRKLNLAVGRAKQRLADAQPALFRALLDEERRKLGLR